MKNHAIKLILAGLLASILPLAGCGYTGPNGAITGSGKSAVQTYDITGFDSIDAGSAFQVEIVKSDQFKVAVTADDNLFDSIVVEKRGSSLFIGTKPLSFIGRPTLKATISLPDLKGLSLSGAAQATLKSVTSSGDVSLDLSGASIVFGQLTAKGKIGINASGAAQCSFTGSAGGDASINGSGSAFVDLPDFKLTNANVSLSGGSRATVNASGKMDIDLSGGSRLRYLGNPTINTISVTGGSTVEKG
jgi:hypothetical protein